MTDNYKPLYRSTIDRIKEDRKAATLWLCDVVDNMVFTERRDIIDEILGDVRKNGTHLAFRPSAWNAGGLPGAGYHYHHIWHVGICARTTNTSQNIVVRRDGSVNEKSLKAALEKYIKLRVERDIHDAVLDINNRQIAALPDIDMRGVTVKASRDETGFAVVRYNAQGITVDRTVRIYNLPSVINEIHNAANILNRKLEGL